MLSKLMTKLERAEVLDRVADPTMGAVRKASGPRLVKNALAGTWLGHKLHPLLTDVVIGAWLSGLVLDLFGDRRSERDADRLTALGTVAVAPTVLTGLSDWSDSAESSQHRVGLVHAVANEVALVLQLASLVARRRGDRPKATALSVAAMGTAGVGGFLGGHLSYVLGVGVDHPTGSLPAEWRDVAALEDLVEGEATGVEVDGNPLLLVRSAGRVRALAGICDHAGGPLAEGDVVGDTIVCPWHESTFRLDDGKVERGPAVTPQPALAARVVGDRVEVRAM